MHRSKTLALAFSLVVSGFGIGCGGANDPAPTQDPATGFAPASGDNTTTASSAPSNDPSSAPSSAPSTAPTTPAADEDAGSAPSAEDTGAAPSAEDTGVAPTTDSGATKPAADSGSSAPTTDSGAGSKPAADSGTASSPATPPADSGTATPTADTGSKPAADSGSSTDSGAATDTAPATPPPAATTPPATTTPPPATPPPATPPTTTTKTEYAPYFYAWGWGDSSYAFTSLVDMHGKTGLNSATLAFVLGSGCNTTTDIQDHMSDVNAFKAFGGTVKASFGGASGSYLENTCTSSASIASALGAFVDTTGITDLDFDVEQDVAMNSTINTRRSAALAAVQASHHVKISFTVPADPTGGMSSAAYDVVKSALAAGVTVSHVNLMVMDYGAAISSGKKMGDLAIQAVQSCSKQLQALIPGLSTQSAYGMIGATPMIGQNDVSTEIFGLDDATTLATWAKANHLGLVAFWAIQRDKPCSGGVDLAVCSNAQTKNFEFNSIFMNGL